MVVPNLLVEGGYRDTVVAMSDDVKGAFCQLRPSFGGGGSR